MAGEPSLGRGKGPQNNLGDGTLGVLLVGGMASNGVNQPRERNDNLVGNLAQVRNNWSDHSI
jgi:hypothetical protein